MCPPVSPHKGASIVHSPHTMRVFLLWKRRCADIRAGTQTLPLRHDEIQDKQNGQDEERDVEPLVLCGAEL